MIIEPIFLLYGAVFLAALLLVEGAYFLYVDTRSGKGAINRRMSMLASGKDSRDVFEKLRRKPMRQAHKLGRLGEPLVRLDRLIAQSGATITTGRAMAIMASLSLFLFLVLVYLAGLAIIPASMASGLVGVLVCPIFGIGLPVFYFKTRKSKRIKMFAEQLPDALDIMVRGLQAGHPISAAMSLVTKEMSDPIGTEFGIAVDEMTYGLDMREALENMGRRVELQDFQYVVVSINIQSDTGGNLAEVLHSLSTVIRERFRMFKKIRAISAEGRLSANVLSVLPFIATILFFLWNPDYYLAILDDPAFLPIVGAGLSLMLTGIYILNRMVNFRI